MLIDVATANVLDVYHLLVGIVTPRPIAWVTTLSQSGVVNLAPFSFFNAFGANPPIVVFSPTLRRDGTRKDTLLNPLFGLLPYLLSPFGLGRVDWVNRFPMATVVAVEVWRWTPFMMLIILAGLQSQNPEVLEAARVDGANPLQAFRRITLPLVRPFIELGALLGSLFVVQTYDSIFMLTYGGPGEDTTNVPFLLYLVAFQGYSIGQASAIGVVAVIITILVATFALRTLFSIFQVEARR